MKMNTKQLCTLVSAIFLATILEASAWAKPPKGKENNWLQTIPGKGWHVLWRIYGPEQAWFDKTWKPGDIELVKQQ
jgi:hypothetical protein